MIAYLSPAWQEAAAAAVAADPRLQQARPAIPVVLAQVVVPGDGSDDAVASWHVTFGPDGVVWQQGPAPAADVTFTCTTETAWSIQCGEQSAQAAFMAGRLRIGGDTSTLLTNQELLTALNDALAPLRATTTR